MKTFTLFTIIAILFFTNQMLSQTNNGLKLMPDNLLEKRFIPQSIQDEQVWNTSESEIFISKKSRTLVQEWDGFNWVNSERIVYTYDGNNNIIEELHQSWVESNWMDNWKDTNTYDDNIIIEMVEQYWDGSNWVNIIRWTYDYDVNNKLIEYIEQLI
jgi:hypothetical protein